MKLLSVWSGCWPVRRPYAVEAQIGAGLGYKQGPMRIPQTDLRRYAVRRYNFPVVVVVVAVIHVDGARAPGARHNYLPTYLGR